MQTGLIFLSKWKFLYGTVHTYLSSAYCYCCWIVSECSLLCIWLQDLQVKSSPPPAVQTTPIHHDPAIIQVKANKIGCILNVKCHQIGRATITLIWLSLRPEYPCLMQFYLTDLHLFPHAVSLSSSSNSIFQFTSSWCWFYSRS